MTMRFAVRATCVLTIALAANIAAAQPRSAASAPADANDVLDSAYTDTSFGYRVRPPKNWGISREPVPDISGNVLLQIVDPGSIRTGRSIMIKLVGTRAAAEPKETSAGDVLEHQYRELAKQYGDVRRLDARDIRIHDKEAARLDVLFTLAGRETVRRFAAVQARPNAFFSLTFSGLEQSRAEDDALFEAVLESFEVLGDSYADEIVGDAVKRATTWRKTLQGRDLAASAMPEIILRVRSKGEDVGFLQITEKEDTHLGTVGIRITEFGWVFGENGAAQRSSNTEFVSNDQNCEAWQRSVIAAVPGVMNRPGTMTLTLEEGLRTAEMLATAQSNQYGKAPDNNPPFRVPSGYASRAVIRMLPRFVSLEEPAQFAFSYFDHANTALMLRMVAIDGRVDTRIAGHNGPVYLVRERQGLFGDESRIFVDAKGHILRIENGELVMEPTTSKQVDQMFAAKIAEANKLMAELHEQHEQSLRRFGGR